MEDKTAIRHGQPQLDRDALQRIIDGVNDGHEYEVGWSTPKFTQGAIYIFTVTKIVAAAIGQNARPKQVFGVSRLLGGEKDATPRDWPFPYPVAEVQIHFVAARTAANADPLSSFMLKETYGTLATTGQPFHPFSCRTHGSYITPSGIPEAQRSIASLEPSRHDCLERIRREIPNKNNASRNGDSVYQGKGTKKGGLEHFDGSLINLWLKTYDTWLIRAQMRGDWMSEESLREGDTILAGLAVFRVRYGDGNVCKLLQEIDSPKGIVGRLPEIIHSCMQSPNGDKDKD